tara:strand:+ start:1207 stop:1890 length:684 start_codon:yes stop_codon:yes gene_type:complete
MFDVSLYGHITMDTIISKDSKDCTVGSIGNLWKMFSIINPSLKINIEATDFGEALILVDKKSLRRSSVANLSIHNRKPTIATSKWHHILYVNELTDPSFVTTISSGIISVDFCRGKQLKNLDILSNVDFVFISDEDVFMDLNEMSKMVRQGVILHKTGGSEYYFDGEKRLERKADIVDDVSVLGCGDMFASLFINNELLRSDTGVSLELSHKYMTQYLKEAKDEQEI